ncbi:MAG: hypothetical protein CM15mP2_1290 [Methanobacteriota archaeon]|nr:MAG: hypothetical protein CM15mP2_1290 [Euryarchaeota archaeon]
MSKWLYLTLAILSEVTATSFLKSSDGFTKLWPSVIVVVGYCLAFYFLSLTLDTIPIGVAYAIWSGVGIASLAVISVLFFDPEDRHCSSIWHGINHRRCGGFTSV